MLTLWNGPGVPPMNVVSTDVFVLHTLRVILQDPPQLVTRVELPATAHGVNLYTVGDATVWYAIDTDPGPIVQPNLEPLVPVTAWRPGGLLTPSMWQQCVLRLDGLPHILHLLSDTPYVPVALCILLEASDGGTYW